MWFKILLTSILIIFISLIQISFVSGLSFPFNELDLIIVFLVFFRVLFKDLRNIWFFVLVGFLFDIFYLPQADIFILIMPAIFVFCDFLLNNVFTNRSLFSFLATGFFTTIFYFFIYHLGFYLFRFISSDSMIFIFTKGFWISLIVKLGLNLLFIILCFYIINFLSNRLRPVFIIKH